MPDILIRNVPQEVVDSLDAAAARLGLSRNEFVRRRLESEASRITGRPTTHEDWKRFSELAADLNDPDVMARAWGMSKDDG